MKIRTQLTLLFTLLTATILLFFASVMYITAKNDREKEFYSLLKKEAITKVNLFLNTNIDAQTLQNIYHNNRQTINEVEVAIYDDAFHLLYHDAVDIDFVKENQPMFDAIVQNKQVYFYQDKWQVVGLQYVFNGKKYIVTAAAYDQYGYNKLENFLRNSIIIFVVSLLLIVLSALFFTKKALRPVQEMTRKAKLISASNLDLRIETQNKNDELAELATTFNEMLQRIENSFESQKSFVSNISHELRTPLAAMIAELELTLSQAKTEEEYQKALRNVMGDAKKIVRLSNSLLDLAKANYDPSEIMFKPIRLDEVLLNAAHQIQHTNKAYKVDMQFDQMPDDERDMQTFGNEYLLQVAFVNLIENACKFSEDKTCWVRINFSASDIFIRFQDHGIGIKPEDLEHIFTSFYRGNNQNFTDGHGIGLALTQKIIQLHQAKIYVDSTYGKGTRIELQFPKKD